MINTYNESELHKTLKIMYSQEEGSKTEVELDGHIYDIVTKDQNVIEIQTQNLSKLSNKAKDAISKGRIIKIVHPIPAVKHIILQDKNGNTISNRKSPKKNTIYSTLKELTGLYQILLKPGFTLEILICEISEIRQKTDKAIQTANKKRRFKKDWIKTDKKLDTIIDSKIFKTPDDYLSLLPENLPESFSSKDVKRLLSEQLGKSEGIFSNLILWLFLRMDLIEQTGKSGNLKLYKIKNAPIPEQYGAFKNKKARS